jgi:hypothetical protein
MMHAQRSVSFNAGSPDGAFLKLLHLATSDPDGMSRAAAAMNNSQMAIPTLPLDSQIGQRGCKLIRLARGCRSSLTLRPASDMFW